MAARSRGPRDVRSRVVPDPTPIDFVNIGDPTSEAGHNLAGWGPIEPARSGGEILPDMFIGRLAAQTASEAEIRSGLHCA